MFCGRYSCSVGIVGCSVGRKLASEQILPHHFTSNCLLVGNGQPTETLLRCQLTVDLLVEHRAQLLVLWLAADIPKLYEEPPGRPIARLAATGVN
jgi:hypothetical protein